MKTKRVRRKPSVNQMRQLRNGDIDYHRRDAVRKTNLTIFDSNAETEVDQGLIKRLQTDCNGVRFRVHDDLVDLVKVISNQYEYRIQELIAEDDYTDIFLFKKS